MRGKTEDDILKKRKDIEEGNERAKVYTTSV